MSTTNNLTVYAALYDHPIKALHAATLISQQNYNTAVTIVPENKKQAQHFYTLLLELYDSSTVINNQHAFRTRSWLGGQATVVLHWDEPIAFRAGGIK